MHNYSFFFLNINMLCTVLYPRVHNEYSKHCTKKKPYRAKRLGIYLRDVAMLLRDRIR